MNDQNRRDPRSQGNMAPHQPGTFDHHDPRYQQRTTGRSGTVNAQQPPTSPQPYTASSWFNPAYAAQYYGYSPVAEDPYPNNTPFMPAHQNAQSLPPISYGGDSGNPSYQSPFNPASQMLQNWTVAQSDLGPGMQYAGQQYSIQQMPHQQTAYQQSPAQQVPMQSQTHIKQDPESNDMYSGNYNDSRGAYSGDYDIHTDPYAGNYTADYAAEDDPSAQLMQELTQHARDTQTVSPASDASDSKYEDTNQGWGDSTVGVTQSSSNNSMLYTPHEIQNAHQTFSRFEHQNPISAADQAEHDELQHQVDQVLAGLDEDMQDAISEEQAPIPHTDTANTDVDEDSAMQHEEHAVGDDHDDDEVSRRDPEQEESDEDTMEDDVAEEVEVNTSDEDTMVDDADVSDAQEAHDSGVEDFPQVEFEGYMLTESPLKTIKKTISKEDKELHHKAWKLQPHHLPAHRYWMVILMHTVQPSKAKVEKDFVWLKGSRINTVETMWNKYREVTTEEQHQILFCGRVPQFTDTVEALDTFGDKLIVFRAAKQEVIVLD
ncbi:hypothetical protein M436DRAFT_49493 [Aureobasidium namibiae CBS 147.97]|uniref:Uncharacterized protein n=1 Tax=Aureobasidium namibiae CBS 147.97 TaxID=1043004 RepID=A0A074WG94_9PEZI|nr:uncharacterized protein M436DRAFT_49493 [Aureobasidium namibiae CBS 147.97]KEQ72048.1 hypothetical protein M436DRAFT_49493 [Aureobasidium namibiae CBS 147.97]